jgi:hypothetical protein
LADQKPRNPLVVSALMEKANQDPILRARLLTEPEKVADEHKITLEAREIDYLKKVGDLFRLADELRVIDFGGPIKYPIDVWYGQKLIELVSKVRVIPRKYPIGYPIDVDRLRQIANEVQLEIAAKAGR